mgnify:CR=1 FL=1
MTQKFDKSNDDQEFDLGTEFNLSNLSDELVFKYDEKTSTFLLNRTASRLSPLFSSTNKILLNQLLDAIHSEDAERFNTEFGNYIKKHSGEFESEIRIGLNEELYKCFRIKATIASECDTLYVLGKFEDITHEIKSKTKMLEIEQKYKQLKNLLSHGILLTDDTGKIIEWNNWLSRFTGMEESKAIGAYYWEIRYKLLPESERDKTDQMQYINYIKSIYLNIYQIYLKKI